MTKHESPEQKAALIENEKRIRKGLQDQLRECLRRVPLKVLDNKSVEAMRRFKDWGRSARLAVDKSNADLDTLRSLVSKYRHFEDKGDA